MAIEQARKYVEDGYTYVVDIDLSKFFDRVNHDRLMARLAARIQDKRVLKLIRAYVWKMWKLPRTRVRNLMERGAARKWAVMVGNTRKGAWRLSKNGTVCAALPDDWFTRSAGVILLGSFCQ